jgi:hypothetical protein
MQPIEFIRVFSIAFNDLTIYNDWVMLIRKQFIEVS